MPNRLAHEASPYLRQHADNPVDWYPWGEEALARARAEDKPILLSIGYSACHWCHVMAHESFADPEVAREMNRLFVNVKVDREERPDLDQIYQTAHAMLTRRAGGWPLTMFLTPDGTPFFGGTYFPKRARYGMPGLLELLPRVAEVYRDKRAEIASQNAALAEALAGTLPAGAASALGRTPVEAALRELARTFDEAHGGFGDAPKFPHPVELAFCLRRAALDGAESAGAFVRLTLARMAEGGIYDQLGGGFCRYSVDARWTIPHFEKMLYDNALLVALYSDAWAACGAPLFARVVEETIGWALREMRAPEGGFYSSLDADSEHEEGKYYGWTPQEVERLLAAEEYAVVEPYFGLDGPPNFEERLWHLRVVKPLDFVARRLALAPAECEARLARARARLAAARAQRVRPARDEKVLGSWNALMARALARAARVFGRADWLAAARGTLEFLRGALWREQRLLAVWKEGHARLNAYLDDYAFLLDALLEMMQAQFSAADLEWARALAERLLAAYEDRAAGGFFFTSHDHEPLIHRPKPGHDGPTPAGNGIAAFALQRLGHLLGETRYLEAAERTLKLFYPQMERQPGAFASLATALEEYLAPPTLVILRGEARALEGWQRALARRYRPDTMVLALRSAPGPLPGALDKPAPASGARAWACCGATCLAPIETLEALERALAGPRGAR